MTSELYNSSLCAPFPPEIDERLRISSLQHRLGIFLEYRDLSYPLEYQGNVSVTFDENWAPHAQLSGNFKWIDEQARQFLDPRLPVMIRVKAGYAFDYTEEYVYDLAILHLRSAVVSAPSMDVAITAASSECELQDYLWWLGTTAPVPTASTKTALDWCLDTALNREPLAFTTEGEPVTLPDQGVQQGQNIWDLARDISQQGKTWFYHDGLGQWHLKTRPVPLSTPKTVLQVGPSGTIVSYEIGQNREEYAEGVIVKHKWRVDDKDQEITGKAQITDPKRWKLINRETPITQEAANAEANNLLQRLRSMRRTIEITAKSAYWLRPGDTVSIKLPGVEENGRISRIQYSFPAGRMAVRIVLPEAEEII